MLSHQLHTLKGCAGQAGLIELQDAVIQLEIAIENNELITQQDIDHLDEIIHLLFQSRDPRDTISIIR
jgi:two-component system secretion sensor histidine kinase SsrA